MSDETTVHPFVVSFHFGIWKDDKAGFCSIVNLNGKHLLRLCVGISWGGISTLERVHVLSATPWLP